VRKNARKISPQQYSLINTVIDSIQDIKGEDIIHIDLTTIPDTITDNFIICHGDASTQVRAIGNHIIKKVFETTGEHPYQQEGFSQCEWIVIDYLSTVVHIFQKEKRYFYQLEELWSDAESRQIANL
jgi:ribosome-associated protein